MNLLKNSMTVEFDESATDEGKIIASVEKAGYGAASKEKREKKAESKGDDIRKKEYSAMKKRLISSIIFTIPVFYISMGHMMGWPLPSFFHTASNSMVFALTLSFLQYR